MTGKHEGGHKDTPKGREANLGQKDAKQEQKSDAELRHMGGAQKPERHEKDKQR